MNDNQKQFYRSRLIKYLNQNNIPFNVNYSQKQFSDIEIKDNCNKKMILIDFLDPNRLFKLNETNFATIELFEQYLNVLNSVKDIYKEAMNDDANI